jgi:hypothetical protein
MQKFTSEYHVAYLRVVAYNGVERGTPYGKHL